MQQLDLSVFYFLHGFAGQSTFLDWAIIIIGEYSLYGYIVLIGYLMYRLYYTKRLQEIVLYILVFVSAFIARFVVAELIRLFYHHLRPFVALHFIPLLGHETSYSFPSGHTIFFFSVATALLFVNKRLAYATYLLGFVVGIARVVAGVHYPSDIVGGIVLGVLSGYMFYQILYYVLHGIRPEMSPSQNIH